MKREQALFLSGGVVAGFALGFAIAWGFGHPPARSVPAVPRPPASSSSSTKAGASSAELMNQIFQSVQALKDRIAKDPTDDQAYIELVNLNLKVGKKDKAREWLDRLLAIDPDHLHGLTHMGLLEAEVEDLDGARSRFLRTVEVDPEYWQGWFYLSVTEARRGDLKAATAAADRLEGIQPDLPELAEIRRHLAEQGSEERD